MFQRYHSQAGPGSIGGPADAYVDETIDAMIEQLDIDANVQLMHDLQRHLAKTLPQIPELGAADELHLSWPAVRNIGVETGDYGRSGDHPKQGIFNWWLDETQEPISS